MFESDSTSIVAWVADPSLAPWQFHNSLHKCCNVLGSNITWSIRHINRTCNDATDVLARMGLQGTSFVEFVLFHSWPFCLVVFVCYLFVWLLVNNIVFRF